MTNINGQHYPDLVPVVAGKRDSQEISLRAFELEIIAEVSTSIVRVLELQPLLQQVVELSKARFNLYHAHIYLLDAAGEYLVLAAGAGEPGEQMLAHGHRIAVSRPQSLVARAARSRQGVTVNDVTSAPDFLPNPLLPNTRSELALPLIVGDDLLGVIDFQSDQPDTFDDTQVRIKTILAQQIAVAVRNAQAFERARLNTVLQQAARSVAEIVRAEAETDQELLDQVLTIMLDVYQADEALAMRFDHVAQMWHGLTAVGSQVDRTGIQAVTAPAWHYPHGLEAVLSASVVVVEDTRRYRDFPQETAADTEGLKSSLVLPITIGERVELAVFVNYKTRQRLFTQDEVETARTLAQQITGGLERRAAEIRLRENEQRFRSLVSNLPGTVYRGRADEARTMEFISDACEELTGYPASDFIFNRVRSFGSIIHPDDRDMVMQTLLTHTAEQSAFRIEYRLLRADGSIVWVSERGRALYSGDGSTIYLDGAIFDISERKQSETALADAYRHSEALARDLRVVQEVGAIISRVLDLDTLLFEVSDLTKERFDLYHAHIYLLDDSGQNLLLVAGAGEVGRKMQALGHSIPIDHPTSIVASTARNRRGMYVNDVTVAHDFLPNPLLPLTKSETAVPMIIAGELIGVLDVQSDQYNRFDEIDVLTKTALAQQIAIAVQNARAFANLKASQADVRRRASQLETVAMVSAAASTVLALDELLATVVELTKVNFDLYHAHVYLLNEQRNELVLAAGAGLPGSMMKAAGHHIPVGHARSLVARAARTGQVVVSNEVHLQDDFLPNPLLPDTESEMALPLIVGDTVIGVLDVQSDERNRFGEDDVLVQTTLAGQIAVAVQNARAFEHQMRVQAELAESLRARERAEADVQRRAAQLETVAMVSAAASTVLDLDELLATVVELTKVNFDLYHVHVYLLDDARTQLNLAAGVGEAGAMMKAAGHHIAYNHPRSLVARAARTGQAVVSNNVTAQEDFLPNPLLPDTQSEMALPLIVGDTVIGVLDVQSDKMNRFGEDDVLVQTTLAGQIAVAVQNARAVEQILLHEKAIENSTSGLTIADARRPDMPLVYINPAFERITGYTIAETLGQNCRFLQADDRDQEALGEIRAAIREGRNCTVVLRNYRKDGTLFWNELRLSPIHNAAGVVTHFVGVQTDITERKQIEFEREQMLYQAEAQAEREREAAERLREVDRLKSQFLANMSHELRTPLNSIIGYSEILLDGDDGELSEEAVEDVNTIYQSGRHLLAIINEILDLAKIEAGQMSLELRPVDLAQIISEVIGQTSILIKEKPVSLVSEIAEGMPLVSADAVRLRQIIMNLVSNALKFTERGSVTVACGCADDNYGYVEVRDTGIGMKQEDLEIIFQQFRQVDGSVTRRAGGTGLGLTITRHLVEMHGGSIEVSSEMGVGSVFRFTVGLHTTEGMGV